MLMTITILGFSAAIILSIFIILYVWSDCTVMGMILSGIPFIMIDTALIMGCIYICQHCC